MQKEKTYQLLYLDLRFWPFAHDVTEILPTAEILPRLYVVCTFCSTKFCKQRKFLVKYRSITYSEETSLR